MFSILHLDAVLKHIAQKTMPRQVEDNCFCKLKCEPIEMFEDKANCQDANQNSHVIVKKEQDPDNIEYSEALSLTGNEQESLVLKEVKKENVDEEEVETGLNEKYRSPALETNSCDAGDKKMYTCEYCHKSFPKKSSLVSHVKTHTGDTPFCCPFCDKKFSVRSNRNVHMLIHTGERPHECEVCNKSFRQTGQLKQHMRIHKGEKPYVCTTCYKSFRNSSALVTHQRIHTGEKPYNCGLCSRSFTTSTSLKTHQVTHTGKMLFDCPVCGRQFNRRNNLNVHIKRHDKNRSFTCPICCNGFVMRAHLLKHVHRCHKVQLTIDDSKLINQHDVSFDDCKFIIPQDEPIDTASGAPTVDPVSDTADRNGLEINGMP